MTLSAQFSLLHSDLNDFLFASIGDEPNGMPLSVISALTRLGIDPWDEAARLAALPKAPAAEALAPMLAQMPIGQSPQSDASALAQRLVALLPMRRQAAQPMRRQAAEPLSRQAAQPGQEPTAALGKNYLRAVLLLGFIAWGAAILFGRF